MVSYMAKHTSGPWKVGLNSMDVTGITDKGTMKVCDIRGWGHLTGKGHGALGLSENDAIAIQEANASLIAAAPDLYAALRALRDAVKASGKLEGREYVGLGIQVNDALSKAAKD
jgi:hypothetical protein